MTNKLPDLESRQLVSIDNLDHPEMSADEEKVYGWVKEHPNRTAEDIVNAHANIDFEYVYQMVEFMVAYGWFIRDDRTGAIRVGLSKGQSDEK